MKWSVGLQAEGEREMSREEIVELADAVAPNNGFATGIGSTCFGAQLIVSAGNRDEAVEKATEAFLQAVARAGLPQCPIVRVEVASEDDDEDEDELLG